MTWRLLFIALVLLMGCDTPGRAFGGIAARQVTVGAAVFDVRVRGLRAEAVRRNVQYAPRLGPLGVLAAMAMEHVSGCRVTAISGDAAVVSAQLDCGNGSKAAPAYPPRGMLECYEIDSYVSAATRQQVRTHDCDWLAD